MKLLISVFLEFPFFILISGKLAIGGRELQLMTTPANWMSAFEICRSYGMELLTLETLAENKELLSLGSRFCLKSVWIAASDRGRRFEFVWTNTGLRVTNALWSKGQPEDYLGIERCVAYQFEEPNVGWKVASCNNTVPYFCELTNRSKKTNLRGSCKQAADPTKMDCNFDIVH